MEKGAEHHLERRQEAGGRRQEAIEQGEPKGWKVGGLENVLYSNSFHCQRQNIGILYFILLHLKNAIILETC